MIPCPRCNQTEHTERYRSKTDNIDELDHSHLVCNVCGYEFNNWNEPDEKLRAIFKENYALHCREKMC
jgi:transposase-like protein